MIILNIIKEIIEYLYYIAGIVLALGIVITINQLKVMKKDIQDKNKRASVEKSIEYLNWFASEFIPESGEYYDKLKGQEISIYKKLKNKVFKFNEEVPENSKKVKESVRTKHRCGVTHLNNQLEFFSAAMVSGLADEELAFNPLAHIFCNYVEINYDVYCFSRVNNENLFSNTIQLYNIWNNRIQSLNLQKEKQRIDDQINKIDDEISKIQEVKVPIIGEK